VCGLSDGKLLRIRRGTRLTESITVLARLNARSVDPVFLVWNHFDWCPMACKVFRSARRAKREAAALASLNHPNIVRCLGYHEPQFTLMEYLEGPSLAQLIIRQADQRLSISNAVRVAVHIGAALEHIHAKGFLHMDLKPDNIIVVKGRPILFDFGSMRAKNGLRPPHIDGTDPYIAPEEALKQIADEAADTFSFGVTLYEMLTGQLPFSEGKMSGLLSQVTQSPEQLKRHRPNVGKEIEDIVMGCLDRIPARRPKMKILLPRLNALIASGPKMWPEGFNPVSREPIGASREICFGGAEKSVQESAGLN
jgi:serine/threonine protein kinase